jgi:hypothetical protein
MLRAAQRVVLDCMPRQMAMFNKQRALSVQVLFNVNPVKNSDQVRAETRKIVARQKKGSIDDLTPFNAEIERLLLQIQFKPEWKKLPVVTRVAILDIGNETVPFAEDIVLPNTKHDLELVVKMLNYMREQKKLRAVKMPLFVQPDEIALAHELGTFSHAGGKIESQISIVLQKGAIMYAGFVFGRDYAILQG